MNIPPNENDDATGEGGEIGKSGSSKPAHFNPNGDLFPETLPPVSAAHWPSPGTRDDEALQAFLTQGPQNQADYWRGWRLGAYVKSLRYLGWDFIKRSIKKPGCRGLIAEYELDLTAPAVAAALQSRQAGFVTAEFLHVLWAVASLLSVAALIGGFQ
jgi:hypothetical protein